MSDEQCFASLQSELCSEPQSDEVETNRPVQNENFKVVSTDSGVHRNRVDAFGWSVSVRGNGRDLRASFFARFESFPDHGRDLRTYYSV